jgi:K+-sensing histidine kinase KdpD
LPHPGLQPNRIEREQHASSVDSAAKILRGKGFDVRVQVVKARNAPKLIAKWVVAKNFQVVVVPDPERPRWRRSIEGDLAREIERRCGVPVHAVPVPAARRRGSRPG